MKLSVIVPSLTGEMPRGLTEDLRMEIVVVKGVSPVGKARSEGLKRASGEYVAWVDGDDEIATGSDGWLERILKAIEDLPDIIYLGYRIGDGVTGTRGDMVREILRGRRRMMSLWSVVTRRELWDGVAFDESARVMEDWGVMLKLLERAKTCAKIDAPVYRYVVNPKSTTHAADHADEVARRLKDWRTAFRKSPLHRNGLYRLAAWEGVWRMKRWFHV